MIRNRIALRFFASFFLINLVGNLVFPSVSWALTSGPTAPEATSFEPVDTTDMVNTLTGDFVYNVPVVEVPGPAGGYPLSLSYHAGIQPGEEASWVGLGWTLNPGAVTRLVNGYPDDHNGVTNASHEFWEGGESTTTSVGISAGMFGVVGVSANLTFAQDTYQGHGVGYSLGVGKGPFQVSAGKSPFGGIYGSMGASLGTTLGGGATASNLLKNIGVSAYGNVSVSGAGTSLNGGMRGSFSSLGVSLASSGGGLSLSAGPVSASVNNSSSGRIQRRTRSFSLGLPLGAFGLSYSRTYTRYWADNLSNVSVYGSMFHLDQVPGQASQLEQLNYFTDRAFDTYDIADPNLPSEDYGNNAKLTGGTFADYDNYSVNAQGLTGTIRPYHLKKILYRQNKITQQEIEEGTEVPLPEVTNYVFDHVSDQKPQFRFVDEFTNSYNNLNPVATLPEGAQDASGYNQFTTDFANFTAAANNGLVSQDNRLVGSRHIEHFTNAEISTGKAYGLMQAYNFTPRYNSDSNDPEYYYNDQIGALKITNENGITYHFALPAYSENEITYQGTEDEEGKVSLNELTKNVGYAYTWYLTAITGPDFVDRSQTGEPNGIVDDADWGYWVSFEYGRWADAYNWRNPATGFHKDLDNDYKYFSKGQKELYYLNYVRTKSHTAVFEKEIRKDGKGVVDNMPGDAVQVLPGGVMGTTDQGGFDYNPNESGCVNYPVSQLRLNRVFLIENDDFSRAQANSLMSSTSTYQHLPAGCSTPYHQGNNVVDIHDVSATFDISKTLKAIEFNADYYLMPETANSFVTELDVMGTTGSPETEKSGKLTLQSVAFYGKGGQGNIVPPLSFKYGDRNFNPTASIAQKDIWSNYKSDFKQFILEEQGEAAGRKVTPASAQKVDAWSLTDIFTSLGSKITVDYESDSYRLTQGMRSHQINVQSATLDDEAGLIRVFLDEDDLEGIVEGQEVEMLAMVETTWNHREYLGSPSCQVNVTSSKEYTTYTVTGTVHDVEATYFEMDGILGDILGYHDLDYCDDAVNGTSSPTPTPIDDSLPEGSNPTQVCEECSGSTKYNKLVSGNMTMTTEGKDILGGGLRVASITVDDGIIAKSTTYDYTHEGQTSGVTSYEPYGQEDILIEGEKLNIRELDEEDYPSALLFGAVKEYVHKVLSSNLTRALAYSREIPGPAVFYEYVTVREKVQRAGETAVLSPQYTTYQYEVFDDSMIEYERKNAIDNLVTFGSERTDSKTGLDYKGTTTNEVQLRDMSSRIGNLKSVTSYYNDQPVAKTVKHYLHDNNQALAAFESALDGEFNSQGLIKETFVNGRFVKQGQDGLFKETLDTLSQYEVNNGTIVSTPDYYAVGLISSKKRYPNVAVGETSYNYRTSTSTNSTIIGYDFYNGKANQTLSADSYGRTFLTTSIPAYTVYPEMAQMAFGGKNMLTQEAISVAYELDNDIDRNKIGVTASSVQTWHDGLNAQGRQSARETLSVTVLNGQSKIQYSAGALQSGDKLAKVVSGEAELILTVLELVSGTTDTYLVDYHDFAELSGGSHQLERLGTPRKHMNYHWIGESGVTLTNGTYPIAAYDDFDAWSYGATPTSTGWQHNSEITRYDIFSHALEAKDINDNFAATRMGPGDYRVYSTVANADYEEFIYTGFEDFTTGQTSVEDDITVFAGQVGSIGHSGAKSTFLQYTAGVPANHEDGVAFHYNMTGADLISPKYTAQVWRKYNFAAGGGTLYFKADGQIIASTETPLGEAENGWQLLEVTAEVPQGTTDLEVGCSWGGVSGYTSFKVWFDDFRVFPTDASMTSYVYNTWGELSHILDANNIYTRFSYDGMGHLTASYQETLQYGEALVSEHEINYTRVNGFSATVNTVGGGAITPSGNTNLPWQGCAEFTLDYDPCLLLVDYIEIDGVKMVNASAKIGGTDFSLTDDILFLENIKGDHEITVHYLSTFNPTAGTRVYFSCVTDAEGCLTGGQYYRVADGCGGYTTSGIEQTQACCDQIGGTCTPCTGGGGGQ